MSTTTTLAPARFTRDGATFTVRDEYAPGIHECRSQRGEIVLSDDEIAAYIADALRPAAHDSAALLPLIDRNTGRIPADPLAVLIPGDGEAHPLILDAVSLVTGNDRHRRAPRGTSINTAPASRAMLRRWAVKTA